MTGQRPDELRPAEMLCVEGDSWHALEEGRGRLSIRLQPAASTHGDGTELHPKIQSKMQTSALLAGFTFSVLVAVLTESDYWTPWTEGTTWPWGQLGWQAAGVASVLLCLTLATLLFVSSIYMYDRLAMPRRYWDTAESQKGPRQDWGRRFRRERHRHGLVYAYMVWVWRWVFSAAVAMAMLGFFALVLHRGVWPVAGLCLGAIVVVILYYALFRPNLGID